MPLEDADKSKTAQKQFTPIYSNFIIGGIAGCIAKTVIAPLDRAKINFQTSEMYFNVKALSTFLRNSYQTSGFFSLWRGNSATLIRIFPYAAVQYSVHERSKYALGISEADLSHMPVSTVRLRRFISGCLAGTTSVFMTYPLDLARAQLAVTDRIKYGNILDVLKSVHRQGGIPALYRGFTSALVGCIPYCGVAFFTFETLKSWCLCRRKNIDGKIPDKLHPVENLCCGATAGIIGQTTSYPLDIVRRRMQTAAVTGHPEYTRSILGTILIVYQKEGIFHGLYKGVTMNWIKGPIASGISFTVFHQIQHFLKWWKSQ